jgi:diguanylate cyclase (GGDEF)-like protein
VVPLAAPGADGVTRLGTEIESRALEVAQTVLERWLKQHPEPSGSAQIQVHRDILRTTELASITLGHFLVTGQFPTAKERDTLAAPGKAPLRETIGLDDLAKLYLSWRDVACETLEALARQLEVDADALERAKTAARVGSDASLINLVRRFDVERKRLTADLVHNALHDGLTGLPNRTLLVDRLEQLVTASLRRQTGSAVLFVDLDRFKAVNDLAGHSVGDEVLVGVAHRLQEVIRVGDTLARLGGDEFVILCPDLADPASEAEAIAERINAVIAQPFVFDGGSQHFFVSASVGVGIVGPDDTAEDLLSRADSAMYAAKRHGGNRYQTFDESADHTLRRRPELLNDLHEVTERGELHVYYQPVVQLSSGEVTSMEALARWDHPRFGFVPPDEFIPLAEESGMIVPIGRWVIAQAAADCARWRRVGSPGVGVAINLSGRQLSDKGLSKFLSTTLAEVGLCPEAVTLEITESVIVTEDSRTDEILAELKQTGVRLAIDDFGTGYSSLAYLGRLHIDMLKVDRSFISGLGDAGRDSAIVSAMVDLAHNLKLDVVAEGVETSTELEIVRRVGCDEAQGYLLGRPAPSSASSSSGTDQGRPGSSDRSDTDWTDSMQGGQTGVM